MLNRQHSQQAALGHSAALVVIGDELLGGKVLDSNSGFLLRELHRLGWSVKKVSVVPDEIEIISRCGTLPRCTLSFDRFSLLTAIAAAFSLPACGHWAPCLSATSRLRRVCREVQAVSGAYTIVITCGGVGPTVDDCTVEAVAHALGTDLEVNATFVDLLRAHFGDRVRPLSRTLLSIRNLYSQAKRDATGEAVNGMKGRQRHAVVVVCR